VLRKQGRMDILKQLAADGKFDTIDKIFDITTRQHPYLHGLGASDPLVLADLQALKVNELKNTIKKGDVSAIEAFFVSNPNILSSIDDDVLKYINEGKIPTKQALDNILPILLRNGLQIDKINYDLLLIKYANIIGEYLLSNSLTKKINPNQKVDCLFKSSIWMLLTTDQTIKMGLLEHTENFTEPIDIETTDKDGDTILHYNKITDVATFNIILAKNPNLFKKNAKGQTVIESRKARNLVVAPIEDYIINRLKKLSELENLLI